jgi:glycosyltransferase involved in cell wall biosynthesis
MPLISVIIPLFNKEKFIEATLRSALVQTFADFEILIINDGSTDKSEEKAEQFDDSRIRFFSKENEGVAATRNFGIEKATGKYIAFLDADDFWYPGFLENIVSLIGKFPDEKVFAAAIQVQIKEKTFDATYTVAKKPEVQLLNFFEASQDQCAIFTSSAVFEKSVFETAGNFDITLKTDEDTDLWIRIGLLFPVVFSWKIGAKYNYDDTGLSKGTTNLHEKTDFKKYSEFEKTNLQLRKFLSIHRFSMALKSKIRNQKENFERFYRMINLDDLSAKQRFLVKLPTVILRLIFRIKQHLELFNIRLSAFK